MKKSVLRSQDNLRQKACHCLGLPVNTLLSDVQENLKQRLSFLWDQVKREKIVFVHGSGKRKTAIQREIETAQAWMHRFARYEEALEIMGERHSYAKTDPDATFMRMKDDHMKNGQLKPAYNIQLANSGQFVVDVFGAPHPNDVPTLKPFLEQLLPKYAGEFCRIVCDAGYESIENYAYLEEQGLQAFIKPANYEASKNKKYKQDPGRQENMRYVEDGDYYLCKNGKPLRRQKDVKRAQKRISGDAAAIQML